MTRGFNNLPANIRNLFFPELLERTVLSRIENGLTICTFLENGRAKLGRTDFTKNENLLQVSTIRFFKNQEINRHYHLQLERQTKGTSEVWLVVKGKFEVAVYDLDQSLLKNFKISRGCILITHSGGHSIRAVRKNSRLVEIKNGPYFGPEVDKVTF